MRKTSILVALMLLSLMVSVAAAGSKGPRVGKGDRLAWFKDLNLTGEQKEKFDALREGLRSDLAPLRSEMIKKKTELKLLWMEDVLDAGKIRAKQKEIRDLMAQIEDRLTEFRLAVHKLLTPEQRAKVLSFTARRRSFRGVRPLP